jgi:hypothetical protein
MNNSKIYRQTDSRWQSKPYPTYSSTFGGNGCGACAITHLVIENYNKRKYTPEKVRKYMVSKGYAIAGQGTAWGGITNAMKYYGMKNIKTFWANEPMSEVFKEFNKGNKVGVFLFSAGTRGGVTWTTGGHYIAILGYKKEGNKHYFYTKDSNGARRNDGWHCYETTMKGLIPKIWVCDRPAWNHKKTAYTGKFPTLPKRGYFKTGDGGRTGSANVKNLQELLNWINGGSLTLDGIIGDKTISAVKSAQKKLGVKQDGIFGKQTLEASKKYKK